MEKLHFNKLSIRAKYAYVLVILEKILDKRGVKSKIVLDKFWEFTYLNESELNNWNDSISDITLEFIADPNHEFCSFQKDSDMLRLYFANLPSDLIDVINDICELGNYIISDIGDKKYHDDMIMDIIMTSIEKYSIIPPKSEVFYELSRQKLYKFNFFGEQFTRETLYIMMNGIS